MDTQLRLLIVDDHAPDAELEARAVKQAGYDCIWKRVDTEEELRAGLRDFQPNLIFSDFSMPRFDGLSALEVSAAEAPDTPFIFVSGSLGEKRALHALKLGATDCVPKGDLTRLAPAVARALSVSAVRGARSNPAERIRRLSGALQMLSSTRAAAQQIKTRGALLDEVCRVVFASQQYRYTFIALLNPTTHMAHTVSWCGAGSTRGEEAQFPIGDGTRPDESSTAFVLRTGEPNICFDIRQYTGPISASERRGAEMSRSFVALPLQVEGSTIGVLTVGGIRNAMLGEQELLLLEDLACEVAHALRVLPDDAAVTPHAQLDPLTRLKRREAFCEHLAHMLEKATAVTEPRSVVTFDIERLHEINASFGRHVGDRLLQCVAERLKRRFGGADDLGYFGGGTFAAVFSIQDALQAAADLRPSETQLIPHVHERQPDEDATTAVFGQPFAIGDFAVPVTVKCGLARFPDDGANPETLLQFAESSLQKLREGGSSLTRRLARTASAGATPHPALERQLEQALENEHFELHYQPQVDQRSSQIVAVEALLRWNCPERGLVSPGLFLPTLESSRLIVPMSEWVVARAASDWRRWHDLGLAPIRLAVNVSRAELARKDFATRFLDTSWLHGTSRCWLDIEIPEDALIADLDIAGQTLEMLRAEGTRVVVDDFAMGSASPHRLGELPIDTLKIDRSFVSRLTRNPRSHAVVSSIVSLAGAYGLHTIAEGVETRQQMQILYSLGCQQSQGFLHSPPIPTTELEELLGSIAA
jgi:diguanylate cyclase (GGDEF)-like protein